MSAEDLITLIDEEPATYPVETGLPALTSNQSAFSLPVPIAGRSAGDITRDPLIMIVDDEPINAKVAQQHLKMQGYRRFIVLTDSREAVAMVAAKQPDIVLLDIMMPWVSGLEILEQLRSDDRFVDLPIIILTAAADSETKKTALELGANDFLAKPVDHSELIARTRNVLAAKAHFDDLKSRAWQLELERPILSTEAYTIQQELVRALTRTVELRGYGTVDRAYRVGRYAGLIAAASGLERGFATMIEQAAPLHDIGMIGLDAVEGAKLISAHRTKQESSRPAMVSEFLDDGRMVPEGISEWQRDDRRAHTEIGARMLRDSSSPLLRIAAKIALTHHERWDGGGFPLGLAGDRIPIEGRITAVADVFEGLCIGNFDRWSLPLVECFDILLSYQGTYFDPKVVDAFVSCRQDVLRIQEEYYSMT